MFRKGKNKKTPMNDTASSYWVCVSMDDNDNVNSFYTVPSDAGDVVLIFRYGINCQAFMQAMSGRSSTPIGWLGIAGGSDSRVRDYLATREDLGARRVRFVFEDEAIGLDLLERLPVPYMVVKGK